MNELKLDHVAVTVSDLQVSFAWYEKVLGFTLFHKWNTTWMISLGDNRIGLFQRSSAPRIDDLDNKIAIQHFAFGTDAEGFMYFQRRLTSLNLSYEGPEDSGIAHSIFLNDPDGHQVEITYYYPRTQPNLLNS